MCGQIINSSGSNLWNANDDWSYTTAQVFAASTQATS
jgi:hypothetical protein